MRPRLAASVLTFCLLLALRVDAVTLSFDPSARDVGIGGTATVDLVVSDLGAAGPPSLGAFLVEVLFDEAILDFDDVVYGPSLGSTDPLDFETDILTTVGAGSVSLDEISFLLDFELDVLQTDSFVLATLSFVGSVAGTSVLDFGLVDLADAAFPSSTLPTSTVPGSITVSVTQAAPEPGSLLLLAAGLSVLLSRRLVT